MPVSQVGPLVDTKPHLFFRKGQLCWIQRVAKLSQERRLRHFFATLGCILISATAFAFVHWPDPWLMAGTGLMGIPWAIEYLLHRNVLPLGLYLDYQRFQSKTQVVWSIQTGRILGVQFGVENNINDISSIYSIHHTLPCLVGLCPTCGSPGIMVSWALSFISGSWAETLCAACSERCCAIPNDELRGEKAVRTNLRW